ncbi:hypothetical protein [Amycolatopsis sp. FDAARGOS 1241]|uniref:hypothetical protein n=1 Tax=Amycolatopsis sp. FDAARGOS 1241 TaxID=2778070 RepID=UPI0019518E6D|nr:hypothetical protein [Amycolatopsis sp. FDAARGOS 1241]QRP46959.1 hypothetical protein I6J71_02640 [Amycolatopsis sp. FDAARGOS 1241]
MAHYSRDEVAMLALAAHEVAHAVACKAAASTRAGRLRVIRVVITPERGFIQHSDVDPGNQDQVNTALIVTLAGREGAARWVQRHDGAWRGEAMRWAAGGCGSDLAFFKRMKRHSDRSTSWLENRARAVVASNWGRIDRLAHKLVDQGHLSGSTFS